LSFARVHSFTRGTPPWRALRRHRSQTGFSPLHEGGHSLLRCFSPLHEGDTSVAAGGGDAGRGDRAFQSPSRGGHLRGAVFDELHRWKTESFSPLHEGDTSVAAAGGGVAGRHASFQSPSRGGHLRGLTAAYIDWNASRFQSPSRGGHLRGTGSQSPAAIRRSVSVPFTRGTPPWRRG